LRMGNKSDPKFSVMPHGWRQLNLGNLCLADGDYGAAVSACSYRYDWPRFIRITDITDRGFLKKDGAVSISPEDSKGYLIGKNDLLFARTGEPGRCYLHDVECNAAFAGYLIRFRVDENLALPGYVFQHTQSCAYKKWITDVSQKGAQANINAQMYAKMPIALPPLAEQRKIVEILRTWDEAIEAVEAEISRLKERLVSLIAKLTLRLCVGKPEQGWHDAKIGELLEEVDRDVEWEEAKTFSLISCGRRASGIFLREKKAGSDIDVKKMYEVQTGDFIVSQKQSAHAGWGMVTKEFHGHHVSPMYTIYGLKGKGLHMPFFNWLCKTPWMRHQAYLSSYGVHIEKMSFVSRLFLKTKIRIPALLTDQEKACAILESAESEIKAATLKLEKLSDQKRGLMQKLLTGEVRVAA